ncbi:hypothetical protein GQ55_9G004400 [Panicum hallii var. hallii]|uniref:Carrier domain-containing protein n=2 Tax=Panicum hallii TaxID=206008 RepID=A0A2T7BY27_9POAL|nr:hypothetical protein PAHAL_9G004600 [Panicum hallii]PUZ36001.1 hypothetical protein GQ55_9G004400 [Panicum hallii var. hallii]
MAAPVAAAAGRSAVLAYSPALRGMDAVSFRVSASFPRQRASFPSIRVQRIPKRFQVSCSVEIVMGLEEAFQISVDESSAQEIQTVGDAAALIDKLITEKDA